MYRKSGHVVGKIVPTHRCGRKIAPIIIRITQKIGLFNEKKRAPPRLFSPRTAEHGQSEKSYVTEKNNRRFVRRKSIEKAI